MTTVSVTVEQIQQLDRLAIEKYGVPSIVLMENAGRAVAVEVLKDLKKQKSKRVMVVCGVGNNAGDGLVAARHLLNTDVETTIFFTGQAEKLKPDAAVNYRILKNCGYRIQEIDQANRSFKNHLSRTGVIVDALFGVGLNREMREPFCSLIERLNQSRKRIVAIDIPSGLDGTTGKILGTCIRADTTATFTFPKKGFFLGAGPRMVGKVVVVDIGIPQRLKKKIK